MKKLQKELNFLKAKLEIREKNEKKKFDRVKRARLIVREI